MLSSNPILPGVLHIQNLFTPEQCDRIVNDALQWGKQDAEVYTSKPGDDGVNKSKRSGSIYNCPRDVMLNTWFKPMLDQAFIHYQRKESSVVLDWGNIEIQMAEYFDAGDFFKKHSDTYLNDSHHGIPVRKLSMSLELSNAQHYTGCNLKFHMDGGGTTRTDPRQGDAFIFPSYRPHEVTKIESGIRRSLVVWYWGPYWS